MKSCRHRHTRPALTILEFLVVLAVVGMLVALMLPAVRSARGPARRNLCSNQMRQLVLSALNCESATRYLPRASFGDLAADRIDVHGPAPMASDDGYSSLVQLLAYMEETALFDHIASASSGFSKPLVHEDFRQEDGHLWNSPVPLLVCPSYDPEPIDQGTYGPVDRPQVSNYHAMVAACVEGSDQMFSDMDPQVGGSIVTTRASKTGLPISEITDGTSKTLFFTESHRASWSAWFSGASVSTVAFPPDEVDRSAVEAGRLESLPIGMNYGSDDGSRFFWGTRPDQRKRGPSSSHSGGVVMSGFVDGHVRALTPGIGPRVYFAMAARGDGIKFDGSNL